MAKTIRMRRRGGGSLTEIADLILAKQPALPERAAAFELIEGPTTEIGSGDHVVIEIYMRFDDPDPETAQAIDVIVGIAKGYADDLQVCTEDDD